MASLTIRNLDDGVKRRLRIRAAEHGRSMEEEAREILETGVSNARGFAEPRKPFRSGADLYAEIRALVEPIGGIELRLPKRGKMRPLPKFK